MYCLLDGSCRRRPLALNSRRSCSQLCDRAPSLRRAFSHVLRSLRGAAGWEKAPGPPARQPKTAGQGARWLHSRFVRSGSHGSSPFAGPSRLRAGPRDEVDEIDVLTRSSRPAEPRRASARSGTRRTDVSLLEADPVRRVTTRTPRRSSAPPSGHLRSTSRARAARLARDRGEDGEGGHVRGGRFSGAPTPDAARASPQRPRDTIRTARAHGGEARRTSSKTRVHVRPEVLEDASDLDRWFTGSSSPRESRSGGVPHQSVAVQDRRAGAAARVSHSWPKSVCSGKPLAPRPATRQPSSEIFFGSPPGCWMISSSGGRARARPSRGAAGQAVRPASRGSGACSRGRRWSEEGRAAHHSGLAAGAS